MAYPPRKRRRRSLTSLPPPSTQEDNNNTDRSEIMTPISTQPQLATTPTVALSNEQELQRAANDIYPCKMFHNSAQSGVPRPQGPFQPLSNPPSNCC
ncbi:hypothetical protein H4Q26_000226 [Puccinia striiformis f. sp. tritici PST-130]|nr:hypothetical protein H4Q26_000226 [Puccinia striiformis f. sp. tritici PST-130]